VTRVPTLLERLIGAVPAPKRAKSTAIQQIVSDFLRSGTTGEDEALRVATVLACVNVIAQTVGTLPLLLYRRIGEGKTRVDNDPLAELLRWKPNPFQTSTEWREQIMAHCLLHGNAYCEIVRVDGYVRELVVLNPRAMQVEQGAFGPTYIYQPADGGRREFRLTYAGEPAKILHLRGLSTSGLVGRSLIADASDIIDTAHSAQVYGRTLLENDATPSLVLKHPQVLDEEAAARLKDSWRSAYGGARKAGGIAVLEEGMSLDKLSMTNEDLQLLETRKFTRSEIAALFRVPAHMIGDLERSTFSNIEHQAIEFVQHCIRPWAVRFEQVLHASLLSDSPQQKRSYFFEFQLDGLLRGDIQSRYQAYQVGRQAGFLSINDIRRLENLDPVEGGDDYLEPLNMQPVGQPREGQA
jgi:HK97 family phage portal protein